ncbi:MAG: RdgB/HAM1 family non-canonical purine NTP pyrophosphatase [Muribaculaceae bacterium]|nr:RdgB/HAM1 family non-canonical purine NTP pyrophosphatase [Muribaculaceae bacterium]
MKQIVFATNNPHKLEEIRSIVGDRAEIFSLADINLEGEIPETSPTLEGNAIQKARWVKERTGLDCFADDTGLMVDALNGEPGVYSARYAGEHCTPADNVAKLLDRMQDESNRAAKFVTVIALIEGDSLSTFTGEVEGTILTERSGDGGFGYDPIFKPVEADCSFAEMSAAEKNNISHRGRATRKLIEHLLKNL